MGQDIVQRLGSFHLVRRYHSGPLLSHLVCAEAALALRPQRITLQQTYKQKPSRCYRSLSHDDLAEAD